MTIVAIVVSAADPVTVGEPETRSARLLEGALAQYAPATPPPYQPSPMAPGGAPAASNTSARLAELNAREAAIRAQPMPSAGGAVVGVVIGSILLASAIGLAIWGIVEWIAYGSFFLAGTLVLAIIPTVLFIASVAVGAALLSGGVRTMRRASEARRLQDVQLEQIQRERQLLLGGQSTAPRNPEWAPLVSVAL